MVRWIISRDLFHVNYCIILSVDRIRCLYIKKKINSFFVVVFVLVLLEKELYRCVKLVSITQECSVENFSQIVFPGIARFC